MNDKLADIWDEDDWDRCNYCFRIIREYSRHKFYQLVDTMKEIEILVPSDNVDKFCKFVLSFLIENIIVKHKIENEIILNNKKFSRVCITPLPRFLEICQDSRFSAAYEDKSK
jgi:hypothetical protein